MFGSKINPAGAAADLGDDPGQSAMFDSASSTTITTTFSSAATNTKKYSIALMMRVTAFGATRGIVSGEATISDFEALFLNSSDQLEWQVQVNGGSSYGRRSTILFRDPGWYHILFTVDTTVPESIMYVNGVEIASSTIYAGEIPLNTDLEMFDNGTPLTIGEFSGGYFNGLLCDVCLGDGQVWTPSDFGHFSTTHPDVWVYDNYSGAFGNNGRRLQFATNTNFGDDTSGNASDLTANNMGTDHQVSDTPYNVFCALNPVNAGSAMVLSEASLRVSVGTSQSVGGTFLLDGMLSYWEVEAKVTPNNGVVGIGRDFLHTANFVNTGIHGIYATANQWYSDGSNLTTPTHASISSGDRLMFAFDEPNGKLYVGLNGTWLNSGDPAAGTGAVFTGLTQGGYVPYFGTGTSPTNDYHFSFGQDTTNIASAVSDGNGYGSFEYTPPTGFLALCRANLPSALVTNPEEAFITTKATETNIVSSMASARLDWGSDYVDILKNSSSIEAWLYRFGADSSNEFVAPVGSYPSYSATYQANSTLSGSDNWQGHSIRIGAEYLTAAGTIAHTNGTATTITHNLATDRYCVLLFEQSTTKDVWFHHPDFSAGSLLKFVKDEALAASTQITNIGFNSCDIGSGAATGTYSYFIFADGGIASMGKYTGNGNADGPFVDAAHAPGFFSRRSGGARNFWSNHAKTPGFNENDHYTRWNSPQAEGSPSLKIDLLSNGIKIRDTYADQNTNAEVYYWFSFGRSAIGGGIPFPNAR